MGEKSKKGKVRSEKDDKKTNAKTSNDDLCYDENSADGNDFQELSAVKDDRSKKEEEVKTTSMEIWKDKRLRIVIFIAGVLHSFQICGITYLLHRNTTGRVCLQSYHKVPLLTDPEGSSSVSERIINDVKDLKFLHNEFHSYVKDRQQETEAWVNELSNCNKTLDCMIKNITDLEEHKHRILQSINVLQKNYANKTEEEKQHLKQLEANFTEKMLEVKQNISRFHEEVKKNNSEINNERRLLEEILQNNLSMKSREPYVELDKKFDDQKKEFDEHKNKISVDIQRINASITKLDGNLNEYSRTLMRKEETIDRQFTQVNQSIYELQKRVNEIDDEAKKVKEEVDAEKKKIESTLTNIKNIEENINHLNIHNKEKDEHTKDKFSYIDQKLKESKIMMKEFKEGVKTIYRKVNTEKRKVESTMVYVKEVDDRIKELHNHTTENEKEVREKINSTEERVTMVEKETKRIIEKVNDEKEKIESKLAGVHGQLDYFSLELNDINLYIVGFLLLVVMAVILTAYKLLIPSPVPSYQPTAAKSAPQPRVGGKFSSEIVEGISRQTLEPGISLISFNSSSQKFHMNLIDAVPKPTSTKVHPCPIQCSNDILRIKPSKVAFVFVDFNERNIILEDPETEIGDLRRLTTEGLLKMGCDVFVVYVRDRGSETLAPGQLYNPQLYSVGHHSLLSRLRERNRVLSVYNSFLPHQVKFLEDSLKRL
ncbi:putative leucine-rich repeat-containing protein DDB_G0290503 [Saccostrea cucullata]|uniref:putative leucine-rich repeat-containing protein DDB_G0290503 n=1 Tax=Saccostrea cuccullata TaxID=36930 RepID=UPI002ED0AB06